MIKQTNQPKTIYNHDAMVKFYNDFKKHIIIHFVRSYVEFKTIKGSTKWLKHIERINHYKADIKDYADNDDFYLFLIHHGFINVNEEQALRNSIANN
jgi:hypothetical protein